MAEASPESKSQHFDLAISLILHSWPALSLAVQNQWGGPDSADKRDWLGGVVSDLFAERADTDAQDVEDVLLQVMADEFEVQLEDGSEVEIVARIMRARKETAEGRFEAVREMQTRWREGKGTAKVESVRMEGDAEGEGESDEDEEDEDGDVDMEDAPRLVPAKGKQVPEVDDEGFTKVVSKKKR
ncbi:Pre-rRNA-processing protein TSR2-domain-containing protein [Lineolata rhizophorae]|uniref:Pre-rRNA-processing protein TSR2-domain-containing protein n=1 Tax=Lineolata rhizophorae TaxID=578093 RepID=A0A6A6NQ97_9PEZI|nr:Pre-rRNA-processing protein TSR2-domain-containing protein [Lineolata rhizophorae]